MHKMNVLLPHLYLYINITQRQKQHLMLPLSITCIRFLGQMESSLSNQASKILNFEILSLMPKNLSYLFYSQKKYNLNF